MPEEVLTNEETFEEMTEDNFELSSDGSEDNVELDISDEDSSSGIATAVKLGIGVAVVGGLALKGAKDITVDYVVPGLKKAGSFVKTHLPFGKGKKEKGKKDDINVVADVELTEEEVIEEE